MVVLACGVRPRVEVARASGIPINRGIIVNDALATEAPGVYAIGECAEHAGQDLRHRHPGLGAGGRPGRHAVRARIPRRATAGSKLYTRLKVAGVDVASMGRVEPELESDEVIQIVENRRGAYRKLIVREGKLVGAMFVGNTEAAASLVQIFDRGDTLPEDPLEALCPGAAFGTGAARRSPGLHLPQGERVAPLRRDRRRRLHRRGAGRGDQGRHRLRLLPRRSRAARSRVRPRRPSWPPPVESPPPPTLTLGGALAPRRSSTLAG